MLDLLLNIGSGIQTLGIIFLVWNALRARGLSCELDGEKIDVPRDEVKESFRRSAFAAVSQRAGGRRVEFDSVWKGRKLVCTTKKEVIK